MKYEIVKNYYNGAFHESAAAESLDVVSSIDGNLLSRVPMSSVDELNAAVESAKNAFPVCGATPVKEHVRQFCPLFPVYRFGFDESKFNGKRRRQLRLKKTNLRVN